MKFEWKPKPRGLKNLKNTCYVNSVLQVLSQCEELIEGKTEESSDEFLNEFFEVLEKLNSGQEDVVDPEKFIKSSYATLTQFAPRTQQDSVEYLVYLFDYIFTSFPQKETLFKGLQTTTVICNRCKLRLSPQDKFTTLGLPIPQSAYSIFNLFSNPSTELSLEFCISQHFNAPKHASLHCSACKTETNHIVEETIESLSPYLLIYLKRYSNSRFWSKISTKVNIPQYIQTSLLSSNDSSSYRLIGMIEHSSYIQGGHYSAYVLRNCSWYHLNDSKICKVTWEMVAEAQAYVLLMKKC